MSGKLFRKSQISELLNELKQHPIPFPLVFNLISFQFAWGVVPKEATTSKIASLPAGMRPENLKMKPKDSDWLQGYGYQMWRCRHNAVRADGANGQYIIILPEQDAVIAMTANIGDMQAEINLIWKYILPALR